MTATEMNKCPICSMATDVILTLLPNGDRHCPECQRDWFECVVDGETSLASRPRKVCLAKWPPKEGDNLNDIVKPAPTTALKAKSEIIANLIAVARAAYTLADNTEDNVERNELNVDRSNFEDLSKALDELDNLPDPPGEAATGPRKAQYHLLLEEPIRPIGPIGPH